MITWYKKIIFVAVASFLSVEQLVIAAQKNQIDFTLDNSHLITGKTKWLAQISSLCQKIDPAYQEIYGFETKNYYINICQSGSSFYYHRQSKHSEEQVIIPATVLLDNVFQATIGTTTYFVGKDDGLHYSSVMQNNNEIVLEPELLQPSALSDSN